MIISHPTGFYKYDIPNSISGTGNVTYKISTTSPNNVASFFPKMTSLSNSTPVVYDPFNSNLISMAVSVQPNVNITRPNVGEAIEDGFSAIDFANWSNSNVSNVSDLPEELAYLRDDIISRISELSVTRSSVFERLMAEKAGYNEIIKVVNATTLLRSTAYFDTNVQAILDDSIAKRDAASARINELQATLKEIDAERLTLQKLIGGVRDVN